MPLGYIGSVFEFIEVQKTTQFLHPGKIGVSPELSEHVFLSDVTRITECEHGSKATVSLRFTFRPTAALRVLATDTSPLFGVDTL